jgi:hypothetical protein
MALIKSNEAQPATPSVNKSALFVDSADRCLKHIDDNGVVSALNNRGPKDTNVLTNGGFMINQRRTAASSAITGISTTTRGGVVADAWSVTASVASNVNWARIDTGAAPETGLTSRQYGSIIASSAGKKVMLSQWVLHDDMSHLRGKRVRLSIKHNQKVGAAQTYKLGLIQLNSSGTLDTSPAFLSSAWSTVTGTNPVWGTNLQAITPTAGITPENGTVSGSFINVTAQANVWVRSSGVFDVPSNCRNLVFVFFSDATGGATDNISVAECQLTEGPEIVDYVEPAPVIELMRCQRRFCKSFPLDTVAAASLAVATAGYGVSGIISKSGSGVANCCFIPIQFPVRMRRGATITVTLFTPVGAGAVVYRHTGTTPAVQGATTIVTSATNESGTIVTATSEATTNGAIGDLVSIHYTADSEIVA